MLMGPSVLMGRLLGHPSGPSLCLIEVLKAMDLDSPVLIGTLDTNMSGLEACGLGFEARKVTNTKENY